MEDLNNQSWQREDERGAFFVSTKPNLLDHDFINTALRTRTCSGRRDFLQISSRRPYRNEPSSPREGSPTTDLPPREALQQIGLARLVTDHVTFAYLSDVYVTPTKRGLGLFPWLIECVKELLRAHPALRRAALLTGSESLSKFYARALGVWDMAEEPRVTVMCRKAFNADGA
ncbi:hypothetical protein LTR12_010297 [Friedmanniomyces endolithicus]|nr:hypothetical protein LTR12_010297 [Friedmanniomyces endolithicus]